ncbi:C1 family peptidase [Fundidesulfovibrio soli]|uniref:C1 family peptidase n=1 Tax=Fundidesulfovibrio soli TaxID=2922716 RepID=UPI001FAF1C27|nr:C1 family peptidase [Fundidesulfovibrio soli]
MPRPGRCLFAVLLLTLTILAAPRLSLAADTLSFEPGDSLETLREKIRLNGYDFTVGETWVYALPEAAKKNLRTRGAIPSSPPKTPAPRLTSLDAAAPLALPASFDWRDKGGKSYIGPIRNQGDCGSCYAFAAAATAEGAYNVATGRTGANCADFSEQFIAFCLGTYGPYSSHFNGCDGADYDYAELLALTQVGVARESALPYTGVPPSGCDRSAYAVIRFKGWGRVACSDIDAIKAAIMANGPVDAAVNVTSAFDAYNGGVYQDDQAGCPGYDCAYTTTNHAITLVGWNDNGDAANNGYWILRNSWGTSWGEQGYMRIKYGSARVSCSVAYLTYPRQTGDRLNGALKLLLQ